MVVVFGRRGGAKFLKVVVESLALAVTAIRNVFALIAERGLGVNRSLLCCQCLTNELNAVFISNTSAPCIRASSVHISLQLSY